MGEWGEVLVTPPKHSHVPGPLLVGSMDTVRGVHRSVTEGSSR